MKKLTLVFSLLCYMHAFGQSGSQTPYVLVPLPESSTDIPNFGVMHRPEVHSPEDIAYSDTDLANAFFIMLARKVDPHKVVLVVEYPVFNHTIDKIQEKNCIWITHKMRSLGFTKFIAADRRGTETSEFMRKLRQWNDFFAKYYSLEYQKGKRDVYGFGVYTFHAKNIPLAEAEKMFSSLSVLGENMSFEANLLRISTLVRKMGYVPVVVAGYDHVLSLKRPCMIQQKRKSATETARAIQQELNMLNLSNFVHDDMLKTYNLVEKKNTTTH